MLRKLSIPNKLSNDPLTVTAQGYVNLLNKKINFKKINFDDNYEASAEDIKYFKDKFETIFFNKGFFQIFKKDKIKKFILEII